MSKPNKMRPTMLLLALIAATGTALAGDVMLYRQGQTPSPQDVARMLRGTPAQAEDEEIAMPIKTRGIKLLPEAPANEAKAPPKELERIARDPAPRTGEPTAFALQVQFPFNSADLQPDMLAPLDAVAEGIRLAGKQISIVIEGHTDASGSADYNLALSRRRAESVKNYLVLRHGLPAGSFRVVGKGKYDPIDRDNPFAAENRRVQFRAGL